MPRVILSVVMDVDELPLHDVLPELGHDVTASCAVATEKFLGPAARVRLVSYDLEGAECGSVSRVFPVPPEPPASYLRWVVPPPLDGLPRSSS